MITALDYLWSFFTKIIWPFVRNMLKIQDIFRKCLYIERNCVMIIYIKEIIGENVWI